MDALAIIPGHLVSPSEGSVQIWEGGGGPRRTYILETGQEDELVILVFVGRGLTLDAVIGLAIERLPDVDELNPCDWFDWRISREGRLVARVSLDPDTEQPVVELFGEGSDNGRQMGAGLN